jgi:hypothetical protein
MRKLTVAFGVIVLALVVVVGVQAFGGSHHVNGETMTGYQETSSGTPAGLSTDGTGTFDAKIAEDDQSISYELTYSGLSSNVTQAHIHFGNRFTSGGVSLFLCSNLGNGLRVRPRARGGGTVTGTLTPTTWSARSPGNRLGDGLAEDPGGDPRRRDLRQRPHGELPGRRDPDAAQRPDQKQVK